MTAAASLHPSSSPLLSLVSRLLGVSSLDPVMDSSSSLASVLVPNECTSAKFDFR